MAATDVHPAPLERAPALRRWRLAAFGCGVLCLLVVVGSHFSLAIVVGESMLPELNTGDLLLINKHAYRKADPQRGDVVLAHFHHELIVKRVVGLPGEVVALNKGQLYINGVRIPESQPIEPGPLEIGAGRLLADKFAVLGDNRAIPLSQLVHAVLSKHEIVGKVIGSIHLRSRFALD
jgi:signal peptidase I